MVISGANATFDDLLKMPINQNNILNDPIIKEMKEYGIPSIPLEDSNSNDITLDLDHCDNWAIVNMKTTFHSAWSKVKDEFMAMVKKSKHQRKKLKKENIKKFFVDAWNKLKDALIKLWTDIKSVFNNVITYFKATYKKIINWFKSLKGGKLTKEQKKIRRKQLLQELKKLGGDICDMFGLYAIVEFIESSWLVMKNLFGSNENSIKNTLDNANETNECLSGLELKKSKRIGQFVDIFPGIIQLLGILLAVVLAIIEISKAEQEINEEQLIDEMRDINDEADKVQPKENPSDLTPLEKSLNDNIPTESNDKVVISICPVYDDANANIVMPGGYIIEFGKDLDNFKIATSLNSDIQLNTVIGYINDIPVKSKIIGKVSNITDRHIVIDKENIITENKIDNESITDKVNNMLSVIGDGSNSDLQDEISGISQKMINMNNIEILIKDYFNYIYKPIIYGKSDNNVNSESKTSFEDISNELENAHKKLKNKFEDDIKRMCDKDNVMIYAEANNLTQLKNDIENSKTLFIKNIFDNISSKYNNSYYLSNVESNYKMCEHYLNFMAEPYMDNPYYDKLLAIIKDFYFIRYNVEKYKRSEIIEKFNKILKDDGKDIKDDNLKNKTFDIIHNDITKGKYENIKTYLNELYPMTFELKSARINSLSNLYTLINEINENTNSLNNTSLKRITRNECVVLLKFVDELKKEYNSYINVINDFVKVYNEINWPIGSEVFINNESYTHYLFTNTSADNFTASEDDYANDISGITKADPSNILYWLRYCAMATLQNCIMPNYWSTGLLIAGAPMSLPIILIPIYCLNGPVTTVIGLGICGIAIYPMFLVVNMSDEIGAMLFPINMIIEATKQMLNDLKATQYKSLALSCKPMIKTLDEKIKNTENEIKNIKQQIALYKNL